MLASPFAFLSLSLISRVSPKKTFFFPGERQTLQEEDEEEEEEAQDALYVLEASRVCGEMHG